jgi:TrmH family RNA methyltransferase
VVEAIRSIKDKHIVLARALNTRRGRCTHSKVLLLGEQILDWAIERGVAVEFILAAEPVAETVVEKYAARYNVFTVSDGIQKKVTNTKYVIPLVGVGKMPPAREGVPADFVVVLDQVQDLGNIGTIIRTCQAFGVNEVLATRTDFDLYYRKTIDASRGSVFATQVRRFQSVDETIAHLRQHGYQIVVTSPRGKTLQAALALDQGPVALVVGNESNGVSPEFEAQADFVVQIPMSQTIESLNVGVAAGISVYEIRLKQVLTMIKQKIKSTLGRELNVAGMLVQQALDAELRQVSNLTSRQVIFMMVLKCDQVMSVQEMCRQFGVLAPEVGAFLAPLLDDALVTREDTLRLTTKGEERLAQLWFTIEAAEAKILSAFTAQEAADLIRQLRQIQTRCIEIVHGADPKEQGTE